MDSVEMKSCVSWFIFFLAPRDGKNTHARLRAETLGGGTKELCPSCDDSLQQSSLLHGTTLTDVVAQLAGSVNSCCLEVPMYVCMHVGKYTSKFLAGRPWVGGGVWCGRARGRSPTDQSRVSANTM